MRLLVQAQSEAHRHRHDSEMLAQHSWNIREHALCRCDDRSARDVSNEALLLRPELDIAQADALTRPRMRAGPRFDAGADENAARQRQAGEEEDFRDYSPCITAVRPAAAGSLPFQGTPGHAASHVAVASGDIDAGVYEPRCAFSLMYSCWLGWSQTGSMQLSTVRATCSTQLSSAKLGSCVCDCGHQLAVYRLSALRASAPACTFGTTTRAGAARNSTEGNTLVLHPKVLYEIEYTNTCGMKRVRGYAVHWLLHTCAELGNVLHDRPM